MAWSRVLAVSLDAERPSQGPVVDKVARINRSHASASPERDAETLHGLMLEIAAAEGLSKAHLAERHVVKHVGTHQICQFGDALLPSRPPPADQLRPSRRSSLRLKICRNGSVCPVKDRHHRDVCVHLLPLSPRLHDCYPIV